MGAIPKAVEINGGYFKFALQGRFVPLSLTVRRLLGS